MYKIEQIELAERAYNEIKQMILRGDLISGEKLNQQKLAEMFGISRTPLLSAFSKLEKELLLELIPRRGAFVRQLSRKDFEDLYDIRMRLEPLGAREASTRCNKRELEELRKTLDDFETHAQKTNDRRIMEADYNFHMKIMELSRNNILYQMISSFNLIIVSNLKGLLKDPHLSLEEHNRIFEAIEKRDPDLSEELMYLHILDSRKRIKEKVSK